VRYRLRSRLFLISLLAGIYAPLSACCITQTPEPQTRIITIPQEALVRKFLGESLLLRGHFVVVETLSGHPEPPEQCPIRPDFLRRAKSVERLRVSGVEHAGALTRVIGDEFLAVYTEGDASSDLHRAAKRFPITYCIWLPGDGVDFAAVQNPLNGTDVPLLGASSTTLTATEVHRDEAGAMVARSFWFVWEQDVPTANVRFLLLSRNWMIIIVDHILH